ncbi:MAG: hypothetical protein JW909_05625 [Planctomycetes bacterium]|nr:hypothetical protein [Planctomycetota bacterium]
MAGAGKLLAHKTCREREAVVSIAAATGAAPVPRFVTGKFCEHLGSNIYNGMHAQVLRNPTFADFPFGGGGQHPDGGTKFICDEAAIERQVRGAAERAGFPDADRLVESRSDGLAHFWIKEGPRDGVRVSSDAGPHGGRAQRVEAAAGTGIAQWAHLPLERCRSYEYRAVLRSPDIRTLTLSVFTQGTEKPLCSTDLKGLCRRWGTFTGTFTVPASAPPDQPCRVALTAGAKGQFVMERLLVYPADHVNGADPDVIRFLVESRLPLLRWPGGNFVSAYRWEDGVGPVDQRPTRPNFAWGGVEPNLFGTDEFVRFCRDAGCEPMICLNAGNAGPAEAARWVQYCNGPADSPMGAERARNGSPEPFNVVYWEIGNELTGRHQVGWTTPDGYADRYGEFAEAMLAVDPGIKLLACGAPYDWWPEPWNERCIKRNPGLMRCITDHILQGGKISADADPLDVYADFMALPAKFESIYPKLRAEMEAAGVADPRMAITELQLFGRLDGQESPSSRLTRRNLVHPATQAEALYDVLFYHMVARLAPFIEMVTHSATVNHGGGLRKERERVYANPCHYAQSMWADFAEAEPLPVHLTCPDVSCPAVLNCIPEGMTVPAVDALAARSPDGPLLVSLVNRGREDELPVTLEGVGGAAEVTLLSAEKPWEMNTLDDPRKIIPRTRTLAAEGGAFKLLLPPYSVAVVKIRQ